MNFEDVKRCGESIGILVDIIGQQNSRKTAKTFGIAATGIDCEIL